MSFMPMSRPPVLQAQRPDTRLQQLAAAMMRAQPRPVHSPAGAIAAFGTPFAGGIISSMEQQRQQQSEQASRDQLQQALRDAFEAESPGEGRRELTESLVGMGYDPGKIAQLVNAAMPREAEARPETFGQPVAAVDEEGNPVFVRAGSLGTTEAVEGYAPPPRTERQRERRIVKGPDDRQRYVDTGELVFPDVETGGGVNPMTASLTPDAGAVREPSEVSARETAEAPLLPIERDLGYRLSPNERVSLRAIAADGDSEKFGKAVRSIQERRFSQANTLRDEYTQATKPLNSVIGTANRAAELLDASVRGADVPVDQVETMYLFVKGLDPTSVVREGEVALAQQVSSMQDRLETLFNQYAGEGALMPKSLKEEMLATIYRLGEIAADTRSSYSDEFGRMADRNYIPREDVLIGRQDLSGDPLESFKDQYGLE